MRITLLLVLSATLAAVPAAVAGEGKGKSAEAREARRLFEAAPVTTLAELRPASVAEVAEVAAAAEGISLESARARVAGVEGAASTFTAAVVYCSWMEWHHGRGIFPYRRWVVGQTYWCYQYGGAITYRASNTAARVDGVCSGSNARDWKVSGGAGYTYVVVHHEADFSCATPWWYSLNDSIWMEPAFNSWGSTSMSRMS